jgi:Cyclic phosphodiesterase-like protein
LNKLSIALWLAPATEYRFILQEEINRLSKKNSKFPPFRAHATLCSGTIPDVGEAVDHLLKMVDHFCMVHNRVIMPVVDGAGKIAHRYRCDPNSPKNAVQNSAWSTFLFLALQPNNIFKEAENTFNLRNKSFDLTAKRDMDALDEKTFLPHISLAYCDPSNVGDIDLINLEEQERYKLAFLKEVVFEGIEVIVPQSGIWSNLILTTGDRWNVIYTKQFGHL